MVKIEEIIQRRMALLEMAVLALAKIIDALEEDLEEYYGIEAEDD